MANTLPPIVATLLASTSDFTAKMGAAREEMALTAKSGKSSFLSLASVGKAAFFGLGAAALGVGAESVKLASNFESSMASVQSSAGITAQQASAIGDAFLATAGKTESSATELASSYSLIARQAAVAQGSTLNAAQAQEVMLSAADLTDAKLGDLNTTSGALVQTMQTFGLGAKDAASTADVLYSTAEITNTGVGTLASTFARLHLRLGEAAPSLKDTAGFLAVLANNGASGSRGVNTVASAIPKLLGGTTAVNKELKSLGVNIYDSNGKFVGMQQTVDELHDSFARLSPQEQNAAATALFGAGAASTLIKVIDKGPEAYAKNAAGAERLNAAHAAAAAQMKTFQGQVKTLAAQAEDYGIRLGRVLIPKLETLMKDTAAVVGWFQKHKAIAVELAGVIGGLLAASIAAFAINSLGKLIANGKSAYDTLSKLLGLKGTPQIGTAVGTSPTASLVDDGTAAGTALKTLVDEAGDDLITKAAEAGSELKLGGEGAAEDMEAGGATTATEMKEGAATAEGDVAAGGAEAGTSMRTGAATAEGDLSAGGAEAGTELREGAATAEGDLATGGAEAGTEVRGGAATAEADLGTGGAEAGAEIKEGAATGEADLAAGGAAASTDLKEGGTLGAGGLAAGGAGAATLLKTGVLKAGIGALIGEQLFAAIVSPAINKYIKNKSLAAGANDIGKGAIAGAAIGSIVPGVGTVVGGAIGGGLGGLAALTGAQKLSPFQQAVENLFASTKQGKSNVQLTGQALSQRALSEATGTAGFTKLAQQMGLTKSQATADLAKIEAALKAEAGGAKNTTLKTKASTADVKEVHTTTKPLHKDVTDVTTSVKKVQTSIDKQTATTNIKTTVNLNVDGKTLATAVSDQQVKKAKQATGNVSGNRSGSNTTGSGISR